MEREQILQLNPLTDYMRKRGQEPKRRANEWVVCCPLHADTNPSMTIDDDDRQWYCFPCKKGGSVVDLHMALTGMTIGEAMRDLSGEPANEPTPAPPASKPKDWATVATYEYRDEYGRLQFCVDRLESAATGKKRFLQWHMDAQHKRVNSMDGVTRCLYLMPEVCAATEVWLVEGEKCVHALRDLGLVATTNPGGSGAWLPAYAESLADKDVILCPDNDEPGEKWTEQVIASLEGKVSTLRLARAPGDVNDIADHLATAPDTDARFNRAIALRDGVPAVARGVTAPLYTASELMDEYTKHANSDKRKGYDLGAWLPTMRHHVRPFVPGDLVVIVGGTGTGKTAVLQNIAISQKVPTLLFEIELARILVAERFASMTSQVDARDLERKIKGGARYSTEAWDHVLTCPLSRITIEQMRDLHAKASLKLGARPEVIMIDYIGLVSGGYGKRYERLSTIAEDAKILAKETETVVILGSQIKRDSETEPTLHDAKDSGSIENSAGLVMGIWRQGDTDYFVRVLKNTRGPVGVTIPCNFNGSNLRITERFTGSSAQMEQIDRFSDDY
jgi:KaiC/GvpD/RAD55 family RecA-like ATPase